MEFCPLAFGAITAFSIGQSIVSRHAALDKCAESLWLFSLKRRAVPWRFFPQSAGD